MDKIQSRSAYWDNIKGFLIFLVVFAHCLYDHQDKAAIDAIVKSIYLFICRHSFCVRLFRQK